MADDWQSREPLPDKSDRVLGRLNGRPREVLENRIVAVEKALHAVQSVQIAKQLHSFTTDVVALNRQVCSGRVARHAP
jgi:hypothetical protein